MSQKTLFQKIADREIPAKFVYEDDFCFAINDIDPQAPVHVLVIPKRLIARVGAAQAADTADVGKLLLTAAKIAKDLALDKGFRLVVNNGPDGGETVPHLHIHLLGGRALGWPPG